MTHHHHHHHHHLFTQRQWGHTVRHWQLAVILSTQLSLTW